MLRAHTITNLLAGLVLVLAVSGAAAETAYVTDNLRLGLHQAADTSDRAFRTLESGQELEIISRYRNYASVRLPDGIEGFVKAAYLVFDKPAKLIVSETAAANAALAKELEDLKAAFAAPSATIESLREQLAASESAASGSVAQVTELTAQLDEYRDRQEQFKYSLPVTWVGGALFVCLLAGFLAGLWWVDHRSRKRYGGIRIY
jgi:SH3 domain protein